VSRRQAFAATVGNGGGMTESGDSQTGDAVQQPRFSSSCPPPPPWMRRETAERGRQDRRGCRQRRAAEIAGLKRQVLEAGKQASLGELLGTTTHEFDNALTTILDYCRGWGCGVADDQPTRDKALERILSAGTAGREDCRPGAPPTSRRPARIASSPSIWSCSWTRCSCSWNAN